MKPSDSKVYSFRVLKEDGRKLEAKAKSVGMSVGEYLRIQIEKSFRRTNV